MRKKDEFLDLGTSTGVLACIWGGRGGCEGRERGIWREGEGEGVTYVQKCFSSYSQGIQDVWLAYACPYVLTKSLGHPEQ